MQVTEVDIVFVKPKDGLIGFASLVVDDQLYLSGIAIHRKLVGHDYRLTYPMASGTRDSAFPPVRRPSWGHTLSGRFFDKLKNVVSGRAMLETRSL